ncbi:MAG: MoaD/ThiS family protein [Sciscionella sp.]|nr:MoaD/ThiS family protein [Sciscionella sp.]
MNSAATTVRVKLPTHLRRLAGVEGEVALDIDTSAGAPVTQAAVLDALESRYPMLRGTVRDIGTGKRRAFVRFFACEQDLSNAAPNEPLPDAVLAGDEPYLIVGAMAGG